MDAVGVGLGLILIKNQKVLIGKRKGSHASGLFAFPGGHLELNETWENCALRELEEECGQQVKVKIRPYDETKLEFFVTNDIMLDCNKHYITIFLVADWVSGEVENSEPHKCEGWVWADYSELVSLSLDTKLTTWIPMDRMSRERLKLGI